jgi:hypothetical protein
VKNTGKLEGAGQPFATRPRPKSLENRKKARPEENFAGCDGRWVAPPPEWRKAGAQANIQATLAMIGSGVATSPKLAAVQDMRRFRRAIR